MIEVEAKVPLTKGEYELLLKKLRAETKNVGVVRSEDCYYERPKKATLRIRKRGGRVSFDLKWCGTVEGIESNVEMEWKLNDSSAWHKLLGQLGIRPFLRKKKHSQIFEYQGFRVELNEVYTLGYYLEIERVVGKLSEVKKAKKELIDCFKALGYSPSDFEPKRYLALLQNV